MARRLSQTDIAAIVQTLPALRELEGGREHVQAGIEGKSPPSPLLQRGVPSSENGRLSEGLPLCKRGNKGDLIPKVAIIGSGAMGRGIGMAFLASGREVWLYDVSPDTRQSAQQACQAYLQRLAEKQQQNQAWLDAALARLHTCDTLAGLADCDLLVECVPEDMALKCRVMQELHACAKPSAIFASNTSTLDIDQIAATSGREAQVIGTHFFIPAQVTRLLEVVPARQTSEQTRAIILQLAGEIGKVPVVAGNCDGFIGNRLFDRFYQEAMYLLEEGAEVQAVDQALEGWGMAIGPLRALDMVGNDIPWKVWIQRQQRDPDLQQPRIGNLLCERGWYGQKNGQGWYRYEKGSRQALPSQETAGLIAQCRAELGITARVIGAEEIISRCLLAVMQEAELILQQGFARCGRDIDLVYVLGYGFPAALGGPVYLAQALGIMSESGREDAC